MAENKYKPKSEAATTREQAKKIEDLEKMLRDESRSHDKQTKHIETLKAELEKERSNKLKAERKAEELQASIQAEKEGKEKTAKEAAKADEKIQAAQTEKEEWKQKAEKSERKLQELMTEKEKLQNEVKLKLDAEGKEKEQIKKELQQALVAEQMTQKSLKKERSEMVRRLEIEIKERENEFKKHNQAIEIERTEKKRLHEQVREVNATLELVETENKELREREAERQREVMDLNMKRWGPLKDQEWTEKEVKRLRKYVLKSRKDSGGNAINLKILVFGPTGNGKSSLCNGFRSAIYGADQPTTYYAVADGTETLTSGFQGAQYGDHWVIDMAGIFESKKIESSSIKDILSGRIPFYAEITDYLEVKDQGQMILPPPGKNDVACVVLVVKYDIELGTEMKRQIDTVIKLTGQGVVSLHLVITCLDVCDPLFNDPQQLPNLYKSEKVQAAVKKFSKETGIPPLSISIVKNYVRETETDLYTFILHLRVLEKIIFSAVEQVEKRLDQKRQGQMYKVRYCPCMRCFFGFFLALTVMSAVLIAYFWNPDVRSV